MQRIKPKIKPIVDTSKKGFIKIAHLRIRKMHLDYLAGLLSLPVLLSAIILNFNNLNKTTTPPPTPAPTEANSSSQNQQTVVVQPTDSPVCKKEIGPISISYPQEGQTVNDNPVCITINYADTNYCSVVWSYRTNNGTWSDYNSNAPCLYNLPNGSVQFQLRVNSTVSSETTTLTRNFTYTGNTIVTTPVPQPTATSVPTAIPSPTTAVPTSSATAPTTPVQ